jgi:tetratricopeptide (TPR) repeat protein
MWQLLLPPVIVIFSFSFLLWFLAKKESDPSILREIERMAGEQQENMMSVKARFWASLEKATRKGRVQLLKMHNTFGDLAHAARTQKERHIQDVPAYRTPEALNQEGAMVRPAVLPRTDIASVAPQEESSFVERPITREGLRARTEQSTQKASVASDIKREAVSHEEDFIASIAKNPKDFRAYEKLGDYYMDNGNIKDAKECYRQVLRLSPQNREVKMKIRRLEKMLG